MRFWAALVFLGGCAEGDATGERGYPDARFDASGHDEADARPDAFERPDGVEAPDAAPCTGGAARTEYNGHCYMLFTTAAGSWGAAQDSCLAQSPPAHLATISDPGEDGVAIALVGTREIWLGLSDKDAEGIWAWVNGEPYIYANWQTTEPNDEPGNADCVRYREMQWADNDCGANLGYLCER